MKTVYIVHGREWSPEHWWIAWLTKQLWDRWYVVYPLAMPSPTHPVIEEWVSLLDAKIQSYGNDVIIIGHSVGVQAILRRAQHLTKEQYFWLLISVAWWFDLTGLNEDERKIAETWLNDQNVDWTESATHFSTVKAIFSDDDPWVPISNSLQFHKLLWAEIVIESEMGHIYRRNPEKWYERLLRIVEDFNWELSDKKVVKKLSNNTDPMVHVLDRDGTELWSFPASKHESILDTAEKHWIDIWYSCRSGACFACACHVQKWFQQVDIGKFGYPLVDVDDGDCLTCISGLMDEARGMEWNEIIIKKF